MWWDCQKHIEECSKANFRCCTEPYTEKETTMKKMIVKLVPEEQTEWVCLADLDVSSYFLAKSWKSTGHQSDKPSIFFHRNGMGMRLHSMGPGCGLGDEGAAASSYHLHNPVKIELDFSGLEGL
jgi:hypothetical protein